MINLTSFSYKTGPIPRTGLVLDCRPLRNPYALPRLRELTGRDQAVQDYVATDPRFVTLMKRAIAEAAYRGGGEVAFGCFGGKHRSVACVEMLAKELRAKGRQVTVTHQQLRLSAT